MSYLDELADDMAALRIAAGRSPLDPAPLPASAWPHIPVVDENDAGAPHRVSCPRCKQVGNVMVKASVVSSTTWAGICSRCGHHWEVVRRRVDEDRERRQRLDQFPRRGGLKPREIIRLTGY